MKRGATGQYETSVSGGEIVYAFLPTSLPPEPPLDLSGERQRLLERALLACGRLDGVTALLPDPDLFLYTYVPSPPSFQRDMAHPTGPRRLEHHPVHHPVHQRNGSSASGTYRRD